MSSDRTTSKECSCGLFGSSTQSNAGPTTNSCSLALRRLHLIHVYIFPSGNQLKQQHWLGIRFSFFFLSHECRYFLFCLWSFACRIYFIKRFLGDKRIISIKNWFISLTFREKPYFQALVGTSVLPPTSRTRYANYQHLPHLLSTYNVASTVLDKQGTKIKRIHYSSWSNILWLMYKMITCPVRQLVLNQGCRQEVLKSSVEERCGLPRFQQR